MRLAFPFLLFLAVPGVAALSPTPAGADTRPLSMAGSFRADADAWIPSVLDRLDAIPSIAIAVAVGDTVVLARGYGQADIETDVASTGDTVYYIASATKPFTALMAEILEARGVIDLGSPLARHLPGISLADSLHPDQVTLRDLLTHTSGIENDPISSRLAYTGEHDPETLWNLLPACTGASDAPLGTFRYTNTGYNIFTMILDRETGTVWQDQLQREIFGPLGLSRTTAYASVPAGNGWPMAAPYFGLDPSGPVRLYLVKHDNTMQSAGGMMTTANDLGRWLLFQLGDGRIDGRQVVDAAVVRATHEKLVDTEEGRPPFHATGYGMGWYQGSYRGRSLLMHGGGFPGFVTSVSFMPEDKIGVAVLINEGSLGGRLFETVAAWAYDWWLGTEAGQSDADAAVDQMAQMEGALRERYGQELAKHAVRAWSLSRPRASYAGTYCSALWGTVVIAEEDTGLTVTAGNLHCRAQPFTKPETMRVELIPGQGRVLRFEPETGPVQRLILEDGVYERVP